MRNALVLWTLGLATLCSGCVGYEFEEEGAGLGLCRDQADVHPDLVNPEIIVSLDGLTLHLFDRTPGVEYSQVYPVGVGKPGHRTPTREWTTDPLGGGWMFMPCRTSPSYYAGWPFIRLMANGGSTSYGLHGPIDASLRRGFVSKGCVRMEGLDVSAVYMALEGHDRTWVKTQQQVEIDAAGNRVDVGMVPSLWGPDVSLTALDPEEEIDLAFNAEDDPPDGDYDGDDYYAANDADASPAEEDEEDSYDDGDHGYDG